MTDDKNRKINALMIIHAKRMSSLMKSIYRRIEKGSVKRGSLRKVHTDQIR